MEKKAVIKIKEIIFSPPDNIKFHLIYYLTLMIIYRMTSIHILKQSILLYHDYIVTMNMLSALGYSLIIQL